MKNHYFLIDYENVQPDLSRLTDRSCKVLVFLGVHQSKIPIDRVKLLQPLGDRVEYVQIDGNGPNALDFHIAFYLGQLTQADPAGTFHVVSKDKGFECLVRHLKAKGFRVLRCVDVPGASTQEKRDMQSEDTRIALVIENLRSRKSARPRTRKTLGSTINALFQKELAESEVEALIDELKQGGRIDVNEGKVAYHL